MADLHQLDEPTRLGYDAVRDFSDKFFRSGCYAPFVSLYFDTHGNVLACCKNWSNPLGNVAVDRLDDIWNGVPMQRMRDGLATYQFGGGCETCAWQIRHGDFTKAFPHVFDEFPVESPRPEWPAMIQFGGSNTCNLECVMCNGVLSSTIRARREHMPPLPKYYDDRFFADLRKYLPHLRMAQFFGGEPFLAHECFRIWDMMIEEGLSTRCHVSTNGTQYTARVERVLAALPFSITVSVDGATRGMVESIRVRARYDDVMRNIQRFREYTTQRKTWMALSYCLMRQNWHEFAEFLLFAEELGCEVFVNTVIDPPRHSLFSLPAAEMARLADRFEASGVDVVPRLTINRRVWDEQVAVLRGSAREQHVNDLVQIRRRHYRAAVRGTLWRWIRRKLIRS